jgi:hypothetical protein
VSQESNSKLKIAAVILLVIGVLTVGFFGIRMLRSAHQFRGRRPFSPPPQGKVETDVSLIRDWMTVPFITRTYHVPGIVLFEALQIPPQGNDEKSLDELNHKYYPNDSGFVISKVKTTVLANQTPPPNSDQP